MALQFIQRRLMSHSAFQRWAYSISNFNKLGLMRDDCVDEADPDVIIALERLPMKDRDERNYRILRAIQLSIQKDILPKEQWTKIEEDRQYLKPYLDQVIKEREEREEWNKNH